MFTVKFIGTSSDGRSVQQFVSCQRFELLETEAGAEITIRKGMTDGDDDTAWRVSPDSCPCHTHWTSCFIENQSGKTIHAIRASSYS